jgi:hypothetical protein
MNHDANGSLEPCSAENAFDQIMQYTRSNFRSYLGVVGSGLSVSIGSAATAYGIVSAQDSPEFGMFVQIGAVVFVSGFVNLYRNWARIAGNFEKIGDLEAELDQIGIDSGRQGRRSLVDSS